jgi:crotonobetainyl-CoA:carnitine CoA-transferase CaiB-like acyl-CoA transferase
MQMAQASGLWLPARSDYMALEQLLDASSGPLRGLLVLDFGQAAVGPIAAEWLGMLGATVIKVESPKGDFVRWATPLIGGMGTTFIGNNLTKLGIVADLKTAEGLERARQLIANADVLIENFRSPAIMERLGLGYEVMAALNPRIIYVQASAFGREGPWVGMFSHEWIAQTVSGFVSVTGDSQGVPEWSRATANQDWNGAMINLAVVLAGLLRREQSGRGMMIETAQLGSSIFAGITRYAELFANGQAPWPMGSARPNIVPDQSFRTADGYISLCVPSNKFWLKLCEVLQSSALAAAQFETNDLRIAHRQELIPILASILLQRNSMEWLEQLRAAGVPCGRHEIERRQGDVLIADEQVRANSMLQRVETPHGEIRSQAPHWKFEKTPAAIMRGCPVLGQDTERVFAELNRGHHPSRGSSASGFIERKQDNPQGGVLAGLRVLEIAEGVAGPLCGMMLRRFGAEVTKIEPPQGDWLRQLPPKVERNSSLFLQLNPGKRSVVIDLNAQQGREQLAHLTRDPDVVITGYRPGKLVHLGISYEDLKRGNPQLIYCEITGWGAKGPMADLPATELAVQSMAGLTRHLGVKAGPPVRQGFDMASAGTGIAATQAILAALYWRVRSGQGQRVEVSMLASALAITQWDIVAESETVERDRPSPGIQLESYDWPPDHGFRCADGSCLIDFLGHEEGWSLFFADIDRPDLLADPRFNTVQLIRNHKRFLAELLNPTLESWTLARLEPIVRRHGGTILPALDLKQVIIHPQVQGLGIIVREPGASVATIRLPFKCTVPLQVENLVPAPDLGEHNGQVKLFNRRNLEVAG